MPLFQVRELTWKVTRGKAFAFNLEFNNLTDDGTDFNLAGRTVVVTVGTTAYRSGVASQLTVPTPANGVAQFRLSDADTALLTAHQYALAIDLDDNAGNTTRYWDGVVSLS